jgi:hypothetical protein
VEAFAQYIPQWGPTTLLAFVVLAIILGRLVPKQTMDDRLAEADKRQAVLEKVIENQQKTIELQDQAARAGVESAKTVKQPVESLPQPAAAEDVK